MSETGEPASRMDRETLQETSARYVISPQVFTAFEEAEAKGAIRIPLILEVNLEAGRRDAHARVGAKIQALVASGSGATLKPLDSSRHHVFARLSLEEIVRLVMEDSPDSATTEGPPPPPAIYKVWPDRKLDAYLDRSVRIVKADACLRSFGADGDQITWAVADSGIDAGHPHFHTYRNLELLAMDAPPARADLGDSLPPLAHRDFTDAAFEQPLTDAYGHGTHVAGIIAGITPPDATTVYRIARERDEGDHVRMRVREAKPIQAVAPKARLISLKVLNDDGDGEESALLAAIDYVARTNDDGRWLRIHGLNLSLGYGFEAEWYAAGQSPLCVAVNRLVKQGVVVVAAAGNDGSAVIATENSRAGRRVGLDQSITDPGNAELAITVGSTHPEQPHTYGISYFSSRGPTADGRSKPDLVAPGERILSAASPAAIAKLQAADPILRHDPQLGHDTAIYYREESGTSMAAPHVSGAAAALLSVRREFIGQPERVKDILTSSATDLKRRRDFQGAGLLDLMRALQSV